MRCPGLIEMGQWLSSSPDFNPLEQLDYHVWGAVLQQYHKPQPKPKTTRQLKIALELISEDLPKEPSNKAGFKSFTERLIKYVSWVGLLLVDTLNIFCDALSGLLVTITM